MKFNSVIWRAAAIPAPEAIPFQDSEPATYGETIRCVCNLKPCLPTGIGTPGTGSPLCRLVYGRATGPAPAQSFKASGDLAGLAAETCLSAIVIDNWCQRLSAISARLSRDWSIGRAAEALLTTVVALWHRLPAIDALCHFVSHYNITTTYMKTYRGRRGD